MGRLTFLRRDWAVWWRITTNYRFFWFNPSRRTPRRAATRTHVTTMHTTITSAIAGSAYVLSIAAPLSAQVGVGTPDPSGSVTIEYIAHASFRIVSPAGQSVLIDPFASQVWLGYDFPPGIEEATSFGSKTTLFGSIETACPPSSRSLFSAHPAIPKAAGR